MTLSWMAPAALGGLALIALPIAIHLLVRQHARTVAYPSLRFLRETQLAALRRRTIQDAALLACRIAIVALAAIALAGPVLQTAARTAGYATRTSRAIVAVDGADDAHLSSLAGNAFASARFARASVADSLADAVGWLDQQAPSSREIVIAGTLRRGLIAESDLAIVPKEVGIRFDNVSATASSEIAWPVLTLRNGAVVRVNRQVHLDADETRVTDGDVSEVPGDLVSIVARETDQPLADAALRAVLAAGVSWSDFDRRIVIAWDGANEALLARAAGARIIRMPVPNPPASAADAVMAALGEVAPSPVRFEPVLIAHEQLTAWSRAPLAPGATGDKPRSLQDEGDRRWLWGAVLILLAAESWIRRGRSERAVKPGEGEARVA